MGCKNEMRGWERAYAYLIESILRLELILICDMNSLGE